MHSLYLSQVVTTTTTASFCIIILIRPIPSTTSPLDYIATLSYIHHAFSGSLRPFTLRVSGFGPIISIGYKPPYLYIYTHIFCFHYFLPL